VSAPDLSFRPELHWVESLNKRICSEAYTPIHPKGTIERTLPPSSLIGIVDTAHSYLLADYAIDPNEDEAVRAERRKALPPVAHVENLKQFERLAETVLGKTGRSMIFYRSVAEDGVGA
jgi:hypothetical protein